MPKSKDTCHSREHSKYSKEITWKINQTDKSDNISKNKIIDKNKINDNINIHNVRQIQNKHKNILGSKKPIVLITDCLMLDSEFIEYVPLQYRIASNKFVSKRSSYSCLTNKLNATPKKEQPRYVKKARSRNLSEDKTKVNNLIEANVNTNMNDEGIENIHSDHGVAKCGTRQKYREFQGGKTLKSSTKKATRYDENSNIIGLSNDSETLQKNMLIGHLKDKYDLIQPLDTNNNKSILSKKQLIQSTVPKNDNFENKVTILDHGKHGNVRNGGSKEFTDYKKASKLGVVHSQEGRSITYPQLLPTIAKEKSSENVYALKQNPTDTSQDIDYKVAKRIKLNRNNYLVYSETNRKRINTSDVTKEVGLRLNVQQVSPGTAISDTDESNTVAKANNDGVTQSADKKLKDDDNTLNLTQQSEVNSSRSINELDGNSLQHTVQPQVAVTNDYVLSEENVQMSSDKINGINAETVNADDDSDCVSLFASSSLLDECDDYSGVEKSFQMTNTVIENYYSKIKTDFNEMYANINDNSESGILMESSRSKKSATERKAASKGVYLFKKTFFGYCYKTIRTGRDCNSRQCRYKHNFLSRLLYFYYNAEQYFFRIITELAMKKYTKFLIYICYSLLRTIDCNTDINCALQIFKKLYELKIVTEKEGLCIVECMKKIGLSVKEISDRLANIVNNRDTNFVNWICKILKMYVNKGEFWDTLRSLLVKVNNLDIEIIETILQECMITQNHFRDVNNTIMRNLNSTSRLKISARLLLSFKNLVERGSESQIADDEASANCSDGISSPCIAPNELENTLNIDEHWRMLSKRDSTLKRNERNYDNDAYTKRSNFTLHPIDDLPKPYSVHGRIRFWKLYVDVYSLQEGLKHNDREHVLNILNSMKKGSQSLFKRACYKILLNELKYSPYRSNKLISHSGNA